MKELKKGVVLGLVAGFTAMIINKYTGVNV